MDFKLAIPEIERAIGYTFKDKSLIRQAFTRTSYCNEASGDYQSNEVLEFLGDSVLSTAIITRLLADLGKRYKNGIKTKLNEGDFSNIKSHLSDKRNLSRSMTALSLQKYLIMGEGDAKLGIENEPSVMEDLFESIIGAIYLDTEMDIEQVMRSVTKMLDVSEYIAGDAAHRSAKNALQEYCADKKRRLPPPRYETESESGPDHKKSYVRVCFVGDRIVGRGEGKNFKAADAAAAEAALITLREEESAKGVGKKQDKPQQKKEKENQIRKTDSQAKPQTATKASKQRSAKQSSSPKLDREAPQKLKAFAVGAKLPSPAFKDLGEIEVKGGVAGFAVECRLCDIAAIGEGATKAEAMASAATAVLAIISKNDKAKAISVSAKRSASSRSDKGKGKK